GGLLFLHLTALHRVGSNNPDGTDIPKTSPQMIPFHPYYTVKDLWFIFLCLTIFFYFVFFQPSFFLEPINNEPANPLRTPVHIVPEWYFLPFYAILRSVPHKLLGVVLMWLSMSILFFMPYLDRSPERSARKRPLKRWLTWAFFLNFILLGYVGMHLPDEPTPLGIRFVTLGRVLTVFYFAYFLTMPLWSRIEPIRNR
ncbi:MAG TPA: cytochrome b, partial [Deltaproteobacteria bacterium]|nr:cytochrome b [Deltaproteobacteria bacterium]